MSEHAKSVFHGIGLALMLIGVFGQFIEFSPIILLTLVSIGWGVAAIPNVFGKEDNE